jgi:hypothetical protein
VRKTRERERDPEKNGQKLSTFRNNLGEYDTLDNLEKDGKPRTLLALKKQV